MQCSNGKFQGKTALVTGSSFGIGRGIALELAKEGAFVFVTGRREAEIQHTVELIRQAGGKAEGHVLDVSDKEQIDRFFTRVVEPVGLDLFCSNAGVTVKKPFLDHTQEDFERICQVNLLGAVYGAQQAARIMKQQGRGGNLIFITSCNAMAPLPGQAFYSGLKCAIEGLTKALAWELRTYGIRVNTVAPGAVESGMNPALPGENGYDYTKLAVPRMGQPVDIGKAVCFLASEDASYITGTSLIVDGGLILRHG